MYQTQWRRQCSYFWIRWVFSTNMKDIQKNVNRRHRIFYRRRWNRLIKLLCKIVIEVEEYRLLCHKYLSVRSEITIFFWMVFQNNFPLFFILKGLFLIFYTKTSRYGFWYVTFFFKEVLNIENHKSCLLLYNESI